MHQAVVASSDILVICGAFTSKWSRVSREGFGGVYMQLFVQQTLEGKESWPI
jgi:hypothetical protein